MKKISADLKYYNANTNYNRTGDCVKRSLSLAYSMDYDDVSKELNAIKRKYNYSAWNISPVYEQFMDTHGIVSSNSSRIYKDVDEFGYDENESVSVQNFSNKFNSGTYIVVCGKTKQSNTHMVCILNGDIYDSWDCSNWIVNKVYTIENESNPTTIDDINIDNIVPEIETYLVEYLTSISNKKMSYAKFIIDPQYSKKINKYGYQLCVAVICNDETCDKLGIHSGGYVNEYHRFMIRVNPRLNLDDNLKNIKEKLRYQAREWSWAFRKKVEDRLNLYSMKKNPKFRGNEVLLLKIPQEFRDKVVAFYDRGSNEYADRYYLEMEADPNDPRYDQENTVFCYAQNLKELVHELKNYAKDFSRFDWDY